MLSLSKRFLIDTRGTAILIFLLIALTCTLGVLGYDFTRAHAVRARLQTAVDAAALAGALAGARLPQAQKAEYEYVMYDGDGNVTTDPERAARIVAKVVGYHIDLQDPAVRAEAQRAAREAFWRNLAGERVPVYDVACPRVDPHPMPNPTDGYRFEADVDWSKPKYARDGTVYYDEFKVFKAEAGVRAFLLNKLFRLVGGKDAFEHLANAPKPDSWSGAIRLGASSSAQALPAQKN